MMTIKKMILMIMIIILIISAGMIVSVSSLYMSNYFNDYLLAAYNEQVVALTEEAEVVLQQEKPRQGVLNSYVSDLIYYVAILDQKGDVFIESTKKSNNTESSGNTITDKLEITDSSGQVIGTLLIEREENIGDSQESQLYSEALITGSLIAVGLTLVIVFIIFIIVSRTINKNIRELLEYVTGENEKKKNNSIKEFCIIENAVEEYRLKLHQKDLVKKNKLNRILHETRTPVTIVKSQLEGIEDGLITPDKNRINSMVVQMDKITMMLKDIPGVMQGEYREEIVLNTLDYSKELSKIVNSMEIKFSEKNLQLTYIQAPFIINTDKDKLNQIIYNLLMNSYKYSESGEVKITTNQKKNEISIKDQGIGISEADLEKIFMVSYRGENTGDVTGEGLGLYIVQQNAEAIKSQIEVKSEKGKGTEFRIVF
jgi:signal transduction histidine kinase